MNFEILEVEKKLQRLKLPKRLDLVDCWNIVKPLVSKEIGDGIYTPVPYLTETSVYKIGAIFVKSQNTKGCCVPVGKSLKILGPLNRFINRSYSTSDWCVSQLPTIKTTTDFLDFKVNINSAADNEVSFCGFDYHQLRLSELMRPIENLQLNRNSHEDLVNVDRFGMINCVAATEKFEIRASTKNSARIFYLGDGNYTIMFGYQICQIDRTGVVVSVTNGKPTKSNWLELKPKTVDDLPLWEPW